MDPVLGSALTSIGGNLIGGIFNSSAQNTSNATNLQAVALQNAVNLGINKMNWDNVRQLWKETNEYNTPAAQRARFEQAGINPYMALSNITGGTTQTPSAPSQIGMNSTRVDPNFATGDAIQQASQGVSNALLQKSQIDNINADTQAKHIDNQYRAMQHIQDLYVKRAEIGRMLSQKSLSDEQKSYYTKQIKKLDNEIRDQELQLKYRDEYYKAESDEKRNMANRAYEEAREASAKADLAELTKDAFPALNQAQLNLLGAQAYQAVKSGELSSKMSENEVAKKLGIIIENGIKSNQFTLSQLGINEADLKSLRNGDISRMKKNSPLFDLVDGALYWLTSSAGHILH